MKIKRVRNGINLDSRILGNDSNVSFLRFALDTPEYVIPANAGIQSSDNYSEIKVQTRFVKCAAMV